MGYNFIIKTLQVVLLQYVKSARQCYYCVIDFYSKLAQVVPLNDKTCIAITNTFQTK